MTVQIQQDAEQLASKVALMVREEIVAIAQSHAESRGSRIVELEDVHAAVGRMARIGAAGWAVVGASKEQ